MIHSLRRAEFLIESWGPVAVGAVTAAAVGRFGPQFFKVASEREWAADTVYSATFDVATVLTAFLFAFYTFVLTQESGFIGRMKRTAAYRGLLRFTTGAMGLGVVLVVSSIPMMIINPQPKTPDDPTIIFVACWAGLAAWSFAAFLRAALVFGIFARPDR